MNKQKGYNLKKSLMEIFYGALRSGLVGFAVFFLVEIFSKGLAVFLNIQPEFAVDIWDVYLSSIGFILTFIISFLSSFSTKNEKKEIITKLEPEVQQRITVPRHSRKAG